MGRVLAEDITVSASLYNLFDRAYGYPGSTGHRQNLIPQDGRSLRVQLTYKF
jgi:iron complex outermembrane receptor protein